MYRQVTQTTFVLLISLLAFSASAEVYCLKDGSVQIGTAPRPHGSGFIRICTLEGPVDLCLDEIMRTQSERELKSMFNEIHTSLKSAGKTEKCRLAEWCRKKGLFTEMFELYDSILAEDPDFPPLSSFIDRMAQSIDFAGIHADLKPDPQLIAAMFKTCAGADPTLQRIGEKILAHFHPDLTTPLLLQFLSSSRTQERVEALRLIKIIRPDRALEPLIGNAIFNKREQQRKLALEALNQYEHDGIIYPFMRALRLNNRQYRMNALDGLSHLADPRASAALISNLAPSTMPSNGGSDSGATRAHIFVGTTTSAVTDFDPEVASAAVIAQPVVSTIQEGALLDVKVYGVVRYITLTERRAIARVLKDINGTDYGTDYVLWKEWWQNNRKRIAKKQANS